MNKESFLDLLNRYQQGNCTENEKSTVEAWYDSLNKEETQMLDAADLSTMSDRILEKLYAHMPPETIVIRHQANWYKISIAASLALAMLCTFLYTYNRNNAERVFNSEIKGSTLISKTNHTDKTIIVKLSDRSLVTLQPQAKITYPAVFAGHSRIVYLHGNAFFSVSKNPKKPFYVYNKNLQVRVLGTSFFVDEARAQVSVSTGKVQVNENTNRSLFSFPGKKQVKGVLVTPNQKAIFDDDHHQIERTLVDQPKPLYILNKQPECTRFIFSETNIKDVFDTLSKGYGISIKLEDAAVYKCTFTGDLENKSLHEQLNLICQSISGVYHIKGTAILITGRGCN